MFSFNKNTTAGCPEGLPQGQGQPVSRALSLLHPFYSKGTLRARDPHPTDLRYLGLAPRPVLSLNLLTTPFYESISMLAVRVPLPESSVLG